MTASAQLVSGVDFVSVPTRDLDAAVSFYGTTLGLECSVHVPERNFAEFETGNVTLSVWSPEAMGMTFTAQANPVALHVDDVAAARAELEGRA